MYFLGIDIGSTAVKAAVLRVGVDGKPDGVIGRGSADYPTYYPVESGVEQNPSDWNRATVSAIRSAVSCVDEHERRSISGISFSSQAGSIYPADENNVPMHDALTWMVEGRNFVCDNDVLPDVKRANEMVGKWIYAMDPEDRRNFVEGFFDILCSTNAKTVTDLAANRTAVLKAFSTIDPETKAALMTGVKFFLGEGKSQVSEAIRSLIKKKPSEEEEKDEPQKKEVPKKQVRKIPAKKCKRKRLHKRKHTIK